MYFCIVFGLVYAFGKIPGKPTSTLYLVWFPFVLGQEVGGELLYLLLSACGQLPD